MAHQFDPTVAQAASCFQVNSPDRCHESHLQLAFASRPPVPQGLIESIGQTVQHQDAFGYKPATSDIYLPPPTGELPSAPNGLEFLPFQPAVNFHGQNDIQFQQQGQSQSLPRFQEGAFSTHNCGNGPNLAGIQVPHATYGIPIQAPSIPQIPTIQATYGVPNANLDVSQSGFETAHNQLSLISSYDPPASGAGAESVNAEQHPASSYGPPPSGNPEDSLAYDTQLKSSSVTIDGNEAEPDTQASEKSHEETLPGLSGAGLDIVSALRSHTIDVPVQGNLGSYTLQIQSADPSISRSNEIDTPDHQKLLSEGLLQSILSAIEQPGQRAQANLQPQYESLENHREVGQFIKSQVGKETLADEKQPKTE